MRYIVYIQLCDQHQGPRLGCSPLHSGFSVLNPRSTFITMLQSNTGSTSFKLQPAPRPRCKKRVRDAPATLTEDATGCSEIHTFRSCFEDDQDDNEQMLTPKASDLNASLLQHEVAGTIRSPSRHSRSSTTSNACSWRTTSSVARLLSAISLPISPVDKHSASCTRSPSATVHFVLSNKSPTPSSPLFPRRTLMRSVSSTCVGATLLSPASPRSPSGALRKRMGWRGMSAAKVQDELAISMSPASPLTPRRAEALHTPTQASIDAVLAPGADDKLDQEFLEPLSATLKALGAKRRTERFASSCVLDVAASRGPVPVELARKCAPESGADSNTGITEPFQLMTATRNIFHLPTWVRFQTNHHARCDLVRDNRRAVTEYSILDRIARTSTPECDQQVVAVLPKTSHLGDTQPASPNGHLLTGFEPDTVTPDTLPSAPLAVHNAKHRASQYITSVVQTPSMAKFREMEVPTHEHTKSKSGATSNGGFVGAFRSVLPALRTARRKKASAVQEDRDRNRRDGWGGIVTRCSWFPSQTIKGPLASPTKSDAHLKTMLLLPRGEKRWSTEEEWEDLVESSSCASATASARERSFLELHDEPRFRVGRRLQSWLAFRTHTPLRDDQMQSWYTGPLSLSTTASASASASASATRAEVVASELITKRSGSVENRPLSTPKSTSTRSRIAVVVIVAICLSAVVANLVVLSRASSAPSSTIIHNSTSSYDPLFGNRNGIMPKPSNLVPTPALTSTVITAAKLSER